MNLIIYIAYRYKCSAYRALSLSLMPIMLVILIMMIVRGFIDYPIWYLSPLMLMLFLQFKLLEQFGIQDKSAQKQLEAIKLKTKPVNLSKQE